MKEKDEQDKKDKVSMKGFSKNFDSYGTFLSRTTANPAQSNTNSVTMINSELSANSVTTTHSKSLASSATTANSATATHPKPSTDSAKAEKPGIAAKLLSWFITDPIGATAGYVNNQIAQANGFQPTK